MTNKAAKYGYGVKKKSLILYRHLMFSAHSSDTPQIGIKHVGSGKIVSIGPSRTTLIATQSHSVQYTHISKIK